MRKFATLGLCLVLSLFATSKLHAQSYLSATGNPSFSTQIPIENGFINVNNGEIHIEIPLATHAQRGRMQLNERLIYDSRIWKIINSSGYSWQPTNVPNSMGGWEFSSGLSAGTISYRTDGGETWCNPGNLTYGYYQTNQYNAWVWTDPQGTSHTFFVSTYHYVSQTTPSCTSMPSDTASASGYASDGSGYSIKLSNYTTATIYDRAGNAYYPTAVGVSPPSNSPLIVDSNGNYFSQDTSSNLIDTLNRKPVLVSTSGNHIYYDVLTSGGGRSRYTVTTETISYHTAFGESPVSEASGSFTAIQSLQLPDGSSYLFTYDSGTASGNYGELTGVTLPTGGTIQYGYTNFLDSFQNQNRWVHTRVRDGGTTTFAPVTISNCTSSAGCQEKTTVSSPTDNDTVYTFTLDKSALANASSWVTNIDAYQGSAASGTKLTSVGTSYTYTTAYYNRALPQSLNGGQPNQPSSVQLSYQYPSSVTTTTTLSDVSLSTKTETDLTALGSTPFAVKQWDYYSGSAPSTATTETDYVYGETVNGGLYPTQVAVKDGSGNPISQTNYGYDETTGAGHAALVTTSGLPSHGSVSGNRGNLTTTSQWINSSGSALNTTATYDDAGALLTSTDPNGTSTYGHDSTDTFVTGTTPPTPSSGVSLPTSASYDFSTGLLNSTTDPNGTQTVYKSYDAFGRAGEIDNLDGSNNPVGKTTLTYTPTQSSVLQYQSASAYADTETQYDGYGRLSRVAIANAQSPNSWYEQDTCYDANGNVGFQSQRYSGPPWSANQAKICSGNGDAIIYDALGRVKSATHADGTSIQYSYRGRATQITDENGVSRITQLDGLGRTTAVCEISSNGSMLGSGSPTSCGMDIAGTGFTTNYSYNLPNHKTTVTQGAQTRAFQTDWLGRTISGQEPERGTTTFSYAYNSTGFVVTRQRPQANQTNASTLTTTTTQYDAVGRVLSISYTDGTPTKSLTYDQASGWGYTNLGASKGRMTLATVPTSSNWAGTMFAYDAMGRVTIARQCLPSGCGNAGLDKVTSYSYDWLGNMLSATDGAGVTTSYNNYSPANEVGTITTSPSDATHPGTLVSNVVYGPNGPLSYQLGNGLSDSFSYDSLGRYNGGWVCNGSTQNNCTGGAGLYGFVTTWRGGRSISECDTSLNRCESFGYDEFNRLTSQTVTTGTAQNFTYVYDRYGNRWQQNVTAGSGPSPQFSFNASNNQIVGDGYDAAGNLTSDGAHAYSYDAEGNLIKVDNGQTATYDYDALNQWVRSTYPVNNGQVLEAVNNLNGQRVSWWDGISGMKYTSKHYWGTTPISFDFSDNKAHFEHQDWVGTERMRTSYSGAVDGYYTSLPFGDALGLNLSDQDPYHFAALEEESWSNTDHAQFRQYTHIQGRWMSPDPHDGSYDFSNPQSLNRYSYALNNPLAMTDPSGLDACDIGPDGSCGSGVGGGGDGEGGGGGIDLGWMARFFESLFGGGPSFHGSLQPRPAGTGNPDWANADGSFGESLGIGNQIPTGRWGIAGALGLPDAGCEFGACGSGFLNQTQINENKTLQQKIAELAAAGVFVGPFETKHSPFHKGQITLRDNNWFCSQHVALDQGSGSGGHPVTGEYHYDLVNPWKLTPVTTYWHTVLDLVPDKIQDHFPGFPTGSDLCK